MSILPDFFRPPGPQWDLFRTRRCRYMKMFYASSCYVGNEIFSLTRRSLWNPIIFLYAINPRILIFSGLCQMMVSDSLVANLTTCFLRSKVLFLAVLILCLLETWNSPSIYRPQVVCLHRMPFPKGLESISPLLMKFVFCPHFLTSISPISKKRWRCVIKKTFCVSSFN